MSTTATTKPSSAVRREFDEIVRRFDAEPYRRNQRSAGLVVATDQVVVLVARSGSSWGACAFTHSAWDSNDAPDVALPGRSEPRVEATFTELVDILVEVTTHVW